MVAADLARFLLLAALAFSCLFDVLTLGQLYVTAFALGTLTSLFTVCENSLFVALVPPGKYVEGHSLIGGGASVASLAGPSMGGVLLAAASAPLAMAVNSLTFLGSALLLRGLDPAESRQEDRGPGRSSFREGLGYIVRTASVRTILAVAATSGFFYLMFESLFVLHLIEGLGLEAEAIGLALAAGAAGGLLGSVLSSRLTRSLSLGWTLLLGNALFTSPLFLVPLAAGPRPLVVSLVLISSVLSGFGVAVQSISTGTIFSLVVADEVRSTVRGAFQAVSFGLRPVGALLGGLVGTVVGVRTGLGIAAVGATLSLLWLVRSPLLAFHVPKAVAGE